MRTIKIAGGGISGLTCALALKSKGYSVEVFERNKIIGGRFHGDFEAIENWTGKKHLADLMNLGGELYNKTNSSCNFVRTKK